MTQDQTPQLLTTRDVAAGAGRHITTISRLVTRKVLRPEMKLPGRTGAYLFTMEEVRRAFPDFDADT